MTKEEWIKEFVAWSTRHHVWEEAAAEEIAEENLDMWERGVSPDSAASECKFRYEA